MQKKNGISLIVLILTIIVMTILSSAVIISLTDDDSIENANEAVEKTNEQQLQIIAQLGWSEAYMNGARKVEDLEAGVKNALVANKLEPEDYGMKVTTAGVEIIKGWLQDGFYVVKGSKKLVIGNSINYDETNGGTIQVEKNVGWMVVGADEKGNLLIVSNGTVGSYTITDVRDAWINWSTMLNEICEPYGNGRGAVGSRSINIDDVNRLTGYNPKTYAVGKVNQYGATTTFKASETLGKTKYTSTVTGEGYTSYTSNFHYYDENEKKFTNVSLVDKKLTNGQLIDTTENTFYSYNTGVNLNDSFALATTYTCCWGAVVNYGYLYYSGGWINGNTILQSNGNEGDKTNKNVRAIVMLSPDIRLTGSPEMGWSY